MRDRDPAPGDGSMARADRALVGRLTAVRAHLAFPPTPPLVEGVLERLEAGRGASRRRSALRWDRHRVVAMVAAGLLVALAVAFGARLVLGAAEIRVQRGATPSGPPLGPGGLGAPTSLAELAETVGFEVALPAGVPPDEAYAVRTPDGRAAALLAWRAAPDAPSLTGTPWVMALLQSPSDAETITKTVGRFEDVLEVMVSGRRAFWLDVPHDLLVRTEAGTERFSVRGNALIWTADEVTYRLETSLGLAAALRIAESVA